MANTILNSFQLSQPIANSTYWTWRDAIYSQVGEVLQTSTATLPTIHYNNLKDLFENVINLIDNNYGGKYSINSSYRFTPTGKRQHGVGQAVDIQCVSNLKLNREIFDYIKDNLNFDQLIWEASDPKTQSWPRVVHVSFDPAKTTQRKQVLWSPNYGTTVYPYDGAASNTITASGSGEDKVSNQLTTDPDIQELSFQKTFEQINNNIGFLELSDVDTTWGKVLTPKECDWISLKQYLLYLTSRFSPQSLYPFVELIPALTLQSANEETYESEGISKELEKNLNMVNKLSNQPGFKYKEGGERMHNLLLLSQKERQLKERVNKLKKAKEAKALANTKPIISRGETGANAFNQASGLADLFNLDPFKDEFNFIGEPSEAGKKIKNIRNIGVRAYGQLVLTPGIIEGVSSKPGPVGFKELEIQAGAQCENGIALISMELQDIQGNKFTDLDSPWSFIYDAKPGNIGGDFWFRYGWQLRVPDPFDKASKTSQLFWNHPGWEIFGEKIKNFIKIHLSPVDYCIMLTQAINGMGVPDPAIDPNEPEKILYNLFNEGLVYDEVNGTVTISRDEGFLLQNYVKLSILNPEIDIDNNAVMTAKLNFRTTGAIAQSIPLLFARALRIAVKSTKVMLLGDFLLAAMADMTIANYFAIVDSSRRDKQIRTTSKYFRRLFETREFGNLVYILGLEKGGNTGSMHPDDIIIQVSSDYAKEILNPPLNGEDTIIRWVRNVLQDNGCELNSAATGSGAGINSAWVITVTQKFDPIKYKITKRKPLLNNTDYDNALDFMINEKDVFSYRFQGSLMTDISIEKTETPNALKIQADYEVSGFNTDKIESKKDKLTLEDFQNSFNSKSTLENRDRNLRILFSQMQTVKISCIAHPWIGPGKRIFVKGLGFFDGEYLVLEVNHSLGQDMNFKSTLRAARMLLKNEDLEQEEAKKEAVINGKGNIGKNVETQKQTNKSALDNYNEEVGRQNTIQTVERLVKLSSIFGLPVPP